MRRRKRLIAAMLAIALCFSSATYAGWQDDWIASKSVSGPSYFEGSKRGYFSAGSFSARWPSTNDNLMTITPPSLNVGCGGIDAFLGGFSFMNLNYLVQKLQNILSAAPAAAFDIALKTLSPQVSETIKTLEAITDRLNGIQLNDCKASKALVATIASPLSGVGGIYGERLKGEVATAQGDFMVSSGVSDLYQGFKTAAQAVNNSLMGTTPPAGNPLQQATQGSTAGCPALYKTIFGSGSLLDNLASLKSIPSSHVALMRGFIGDVNIKSPADTHATLDAQYISPCDMNENVENFFVGATEVRTTVTATCTPSTDVNRNLINYSSVMMAAIANKLRSGTAYDATEAGFLNTVPASVLAVLRTSIATNTETQMIGQLSEVVAKLYAYAMLTDMFGRMSVMIATAHQVSSSTKGSAAGQDENTCKKEMYAAVETQLLALEEKTRIRMVDIRDSIVASTEQLNAMQTMADNWRKANERIGYETRMRFPAGVANHALGG